VTVRAVIIGIEKYDDASLDVDAPAANAVAMAQWAKNHGIAAADIFLFVSSLDHALSATLDAMGIRNRGTKKYDIETALRTNLPVVEDGSSLLFYWSGHGMTDVNGQRLFFCSDYTAQLTDRVFNATLFFRELRNDYYAGYRRQLVLADVCGTNSQMPVRPANYDPGTPRKRSQLIYFATPEGGYALAATREGAFTHHARRVLNNFEGFPDFVAFKEQLDKELRASELPRFLLDGRSEDDEWQDRFGRASASEDQTANSLVELLVGLRIRHTEATASFQATVSALKNPRLLAAEGLTGMVRELSDLREPIRGATHGLVQFVLRLSQALPQHMVALTAWLARWAQQETVDYEAEKLRVEHGRSALIVDVVSDQRGEIAHLRPMLRSLDQTQSRGPRFGPIPVRSWEEVDDAVQGILQQLDKEGFHDIEIHFIVDTTVFDRPFHRLRGLNRPLLGEEFGVLLHHRTRVQRSLSTPKRIWQERARAVSCKAPADLAWTRCAQHQDLPRTADLCLAGWPPNGLGKMVLDKLVMLGVPFIYWPHSEDEPDVERDLTQIVKGLGTLSAMSDAIRQKRLAEVISSGSLLWDDASFNPYGG
jgi:hypothetical protein